MNLKALLWWSLSSLIVWFVITNLFGMIFNIFEGQDSHSILVRALEGTEIPVAFFVNYIIIVGVILIVPIVLWSFIVRLLPIFERNRPSQVVSFALYSIIIGAILLYHFSFNEPMAIYIASFTVASLNISRYTSSKLGPGCFAA